MASGITHDVKSLRVVISRPSYLHFSSLAKRATDSSEREKLGERENKRERNKRERICESVYYKSSSSRGARHTRLATAACCRKQLTSHHVRVFFLRSHPPPYCTQECSFNHLSSHALSSPFCLLPPPLLLRDGSIISC